MKKMYVLLVALSILPLAIDVNAQAYKPCLNYRTTIRVYTGTEWQDAFIDDLTMAKVRHSNSKNADIITRVFREDSEGRVYEKITTENGSTVERLTIDMTLVRGDKFTFYEDEEAISVADVYVKDGRKTIVFDKKIEYQSGDDYIGEPFTVKDSIKFIEGVGCNMGLLYRYQLDGGRYNQLMSCRYDGESMVYEVNDTHFSHCNIVRKDKESYESIFGKESTKYNIFVPLVTKSVGLGITGVTNSFYFKSSDTKLINGVSYNTSGSYCVREELATGRVFGYDVLRDRDIMTCDMSLGVGDIFILPFYDDMPIYYENGCVIIVDSIEHIDGKKIIYFKPINTQPSHFYDENYTCLENNISLKFIEGVGPIYGPIVNLYYYYLGVVLCIEKDDSVYYITDNEVGCSFHNLQVADNKYNKLKIYPNPATDEITIELPEACDGTITIFDMFGHKIYNNAINNSISKDNILTVDISHFAASIFTVMFIVKQERIISKFIKSK